MWGTVGREGWGAVEGGRWEAQSPRKRALPNINLTESVHCQTSRNARARATPPNGTWLAWYVPNHLPLSVAGRVVRYAWSGECGVRWGGTCIHLVCSVDGRVVRVVLALQLEHRVVDGGLQVRVLSVHHQPHACAVGGSGLD